MKYKILHYCGRLNDGGAETMIREYALNINKDIFDFSILVNYPYADTANTKILLANNIRIIPIYNKYTFGIKVWDRLMRWWYFPYRLKKILSVEKPDVFHAHLELLQYLKPLSNCLSSLKFFYTCHTEPAVQFTGNNKKEGDAASYLIQNANMRIIALHDKMAAEINKMFGVNNTLVLRNGIDLSKFDEQSCTKTLIRNELGIPSDAYVIGHVGRFNIYKNHRFLISVFKECLSERPDAFLLLVGSGELQNEIRELVISENLSKHVLILSHRTDVNRLYKVMDVFAFPSLFEGLGIVLIEAQMAGMKCLVSDKIPREAIISSNVMSLPLNISTQRWAYFLLHREKIKGQTIVDPQEYDMKNVIHRLESFYIEK